MTAPLQSATGTTGTSTTSTPTPGLVEVGAADSDGSLRLWKAQQAVSNAEARLTAHLGSVGRLTASASSLLGWSVTISVPLAGVVFSLASLGSTATAAKQAAPSMLPGYLLWPALCALASIMLAAFCCVVVLWPNNWYPPGGDPESIWQSSLTTELEIQEALVLGYVKAIKTNADTLTRLQFWLRGAWILFPASPLTGLVAYLVQSYPL
jgi:hypothetical protein